MEWAIITIYTSKCAQMDPQQLLKMSKFYSRCKSVTSKNLRELVPPLLGSPKVKSITHKIFILVTRNFIPCSRTTWQVRWSGDHRLRTAALQETHTLIIWCCPIFATVVAVWYLCPIFQTQWGNCQARLEGIEYHLQTDIAVKVTQGSSAYLDRQEDSFKMCFRIILRGNIDVLNCLK